MNKEADEKVLELLDAIERLGGGSAAVKDASLHILRMCFKNGKVPESIRPTADGGIEFGWYPIQGTKAAYTCLEIFEDGEAVAAWSCGPLGDGAWDIGVFKIDEEADVKAVGDALIELDVNILRAMGAK